MHDLHVFTGHLLVLLLIEGVPTILVAAFAWATGNPVGWRKFERLVLVMAFLNVAFAAIVGVGRTMTTDSSAWVGAFAVAMLFALFCYFVARKFDSDDYVRSVRQRRSEQKRARALYVDLER